MADSPDSEAIVKKEPEAPAADPIVSRSTSGALLVCALLLSATLAWALYDEIYGQRPWKSMQQEFVRRENRLLRKLKATAGKTEQEIKASPEYQQLEAEAKEASNKIQPRRNEIDAQVKVLEDQLTSVTDDYQNVRGAITVDYYNIETAHSKSKQDSIRQEIEKKKNDKKDIYWPVGDGTGRIEKKQLNFMEMEAAYNGLKEKKADLMTERGNLLKEPGEKEKKRAEYLKANVTGLTADQINSLLKRNQKFDFAMRQINVQGDALVDRCETCHLGVREPLNITAADMRPVRDKKLRKEDSLAYAFVSHPNKELLAIHNPDRFGCSSCHGGNGRATTNEEKGHGRHRFWLHPMYERENTEAGCQQCHMADRELLGASVLNLGKDLFQNRGCVGCHRYEGFDRETDALSNARQNIAQLEEQIEANKLEARQATEGVGAAAEDQVQKLLARSEYLNVMNSQLAARISQLQTQSKYLMHDQKKVGPNLKDVRLKLKKEWIPVWLEDPQAFRPGTKMPTYWRLDGKGNRTDPDNQRETNERKAIAAFLWQDSFEGKLPEMASGDATKGKERFETIGCMACHSTGDKSQGTEVGGDFAANLTRIGEKASFDYIVRWIYNPRERWAPYCPKEKRDLSREDYEKKGLPFVFDTDHSTCPNDGAELQIQNMTVMPNFRLSESDSRDIATYLFSLSQPPSYPDASFMDDPKLKEQGHNLVKQYGCAGCHEIRGFEEEQRIGKELTTEGSTPIERLDFAMLTYDAEEGVNPHTEKLEGEGDHFVDPKTGKEKPWYNHKGFFTNKLRDPSIYDKGKEKEAKDLLKMPKPYLKPEWNVALTTFLMGSKGLEGSNVPASFFYNPDTRQKDIQDGWWLIKKYNCMGCHNVQVGQKSILSGLPKYQDADWKEQLPPQLTSEGARVDPEWLLRFLRDPSLSGIGEEGNKADQSPGVQQATAVGAQKSGQTNGAAAAPTEASVTQRIEGHLKPQPGLDRNGIRTYLKARMPTFSFSPNELRTLVRFFMAVSSQPEIYIKEKQEPLTEEERILARQLFTSRAAPCLKCHITGEPEHDKTASAPNFLLAGERLKPAWTFRWLLDPQQISPGTAMPSGLFKQDGQRWIFSGETPAAFATYPKDHADLLVRYMFQMTPEEQRRLMSTSPAATSAQPPSPAAGETPATNGQKVSRNFRRSRSRRGVYAAHRGSPKKQARVNKIRESGSHHSSKRALE